MQNISIIHVGVNSVLLVGVLVPILTIVAFLLGVGVTSLIAAMKFRGSLTVRMINQVG